MAFTTPRSSRLSINVIKIDNVIITYMRQLTKVQITNKTNFIMRKKLFFAAVALVALASCTSDEFVGVETPQDNSPSTSNAIVFTSGTKGTTRADHVGADAANLLNNKFIVGGFKGATGTSTAYNSDGAITTQGVPATGKVFDNYIVSWSENSAGKTESNSSDWEYAGTTAEAPSGIAGNTQSIKYWDYSTDQYDFIAYSTSNATIVTSSDELDGGKVLVSSINPANAGDVAKGAYTLKGNTDALQKCYIADMVTVYKDGTSLSPAQPKYQDIVKFTFRSLVSKVRVGLYETIPGYAIKDVKFYTDAATYLNSIDDTKKVSNATLFTTGSTNNDNFYSSGEYKVYFPTIGKDNIAESDYNKAHVIFTADGTGKGTTMDWGTLDYKTAPKHKEGGSDTRWLARNSADATFAGTGAPYYKIVLPNEAGTILELRVDYTLVSEDGSGETINIYGATAFVPAIYAAWKPNYAYTYLFKISDNTNGWTSNIVDDSGNPTDPAGLYPITFDAIVIDSQDYEQTTITTVATPSVTTYQKGHVYSDGTAEDAGGYEYTAAKGDIYIQVMDNSVTPAALKDDLDDSKHHLWKVTKETGSNVEISEATVMEAINIRESYSGGVLKGRNGLTLTLDQTESGFTTIPGVDGNDITITANTAAKFTPSDNTIYAYAYTVQDNRNTTFPTGYYFETKPSDWANTYSKYYTDKECTTQASATFEPGDYYQKITNYNIDLAVKVIRVQ